MPGRSAARPLSEVPLRLLCAATLALAALPALADPKISAADAATLAAIAAPTPAVDAMAMPDRTQMFATNINQLATIQASASPAVRSVSSGRIQSVLLRAMALLGTPYRWGGNSPERGFDCSGLVGYVFRTALGIDLPRVSRDQAKSGELVVDRAALTAGDLVFFGRRGRVDHVGIYVGEGQFVHAPRTGKDVMVSQMDSGYWDNKFMQARRITL